jgi:hypothetical protein
MRTLGKEGIAAASKSDCAKVLISQLWQMAAILLGFGGEHKRKF